VSVFFAILGSTLLIKINQKRGVVIFVRVDGEGWERQRGLKPPIRFNWDSKRTEICVSAIA
jgi:hypothetical protein